MSGFFISYDGLPALGRVHLGKFGFSEVNAEASGTYLPGPTDPGVEVIVFKPPPLLKPKVYNGSLWNSGLSLGKYCGPGVYSKELSYF